MWRRIIGGVTIDTTMHSISNGGAGTWSIFTEYSKYSKYANVPMIVNQTEFYKTYQIMNKSMLTELDKDIRQGDINSFKLVRRAFLEKDSPLPNKDDKADIDDAFDSAVRMVIHAARRRQEVRLLIATHNTESIRKAIFEANMTLKSNDSEPSSNQIQFALAPGMGGDAAEKIIIKQGYMIHNMYLSRL